MTVRGPVHRRPVLRLTASGPAPLGHRSRLPLSGHRRRLTGS
ncbi:MULTISPECIES: hypothetical protein [unclassified Streptomyces]|nr:hypothetical protein [Streptomyces sp. NBC_01237]WRZ73983.1 hypothetical protein OG251_21445 [Streptomyces sp. NBC_01237]